MNEITTTSIDAMSDVSSVGINTVELYITKTLDYLVSIVPNIVGAILILWIGFKIVNLINKGLEKVMEKYDWDEMLETFITSLVGMIMKVIVFISAAGVLGVETSSFVAMLAAAGLAIGMALSGTLQNFAGGVMILLFKPFKIGDFIEAGGHSGGVKEIHIFNTIILSGDKKRIIIPNSDISNGSVINYSSEPKRRVDLVIGVSYDDDIDKVKTTLKEIAEKNENIIQKMGLTIVLGELGDNSVNFNFRFFVKSADYWSVRGDILEDVKKTFDKKGISFPFPQRDVHLYNEK